MTNDHILKNKQKVEKEVGFGTFGKVYKAVHTETGLVVAIKRLPTLLVPQREIEMSLMEAEILSKVNHKHVVRFIEAIREPNFLNLVLEFVLKKKKKTDLLLCVGS